VIEIGPGTGALTERLAAAAGRVIAVEVDQRLQPILEEQFNGFGNVRFVFEDVLDVDLPRLADDRDFIIVANLPYYITSAILRHVLENPRRPRRLIITVQLEVAERIIAKPGDMSLLAVSVQFYGRAQIMMRLNPAVFWPRPDVESAVVRIDVLDSPSVAVPNEQIFFRVARAGFSQKRKQLRNAIAGGLGIRSAEADDVLRGAGLDPQRRAETLTLEEWAALTRVYASR
jgi:16S rRNA (adenine1518-N6/adenine1519-N6)-dimethyltransferase